MSDKTLKTQTFSLKTCPCESVVVFSDRAEVRRVLKMKLANGENEIIFVNLTNEINTDSVRVEGHGEATVLDVIVINRETPTNQVDSHEKVKELENEIKPLETKLSTLNLKKQRYSKQTQILNDFSQKLCLENRIGIQKSSSVESKNEENIDNFMDFLDIYSKRLESYDNEVFTINKDIKQNQELLNAARSNLLKIKTPSQTTVFEIKILMECKSDNTNVELRISYVVNNASWTPKYDIRVGRDKSMTINYFGLIKQATSEDWNDTNLSLSTAVPSIGGNIPILETLNVKFKPKYQHKQEYYNAGLSYSAQYDALAVLDSYDPTIEDDFRALNSREAPKLQILKTEVKEGTISSTFDIPRKATIPADNNTHKVSIGIIELKPEFVYETVPKLSPHAFLKAKVTNTSNYAMLAGPANVFFDNNFVAKTELKSYSPQEEFTCSLGVDPQIRVDYKPIRKYQEQSGIISKTKSTTYEQLIEIKNTTQNAIKILLSEQLPLSSDEKINIKLLNPVIHKNNPKIKINKSNNIEYDMVIDAGKKEEVTIKYVIEHPSQEEIEFN